MILELLSKNRSYRRFNNDRKITREELVKMIEGARLTGCTANLQRVRYVLTNDTDTCDKIFDTLTFAGYLKEWQGPTLSQRPTAYITLMTKTEPDTNLAIDVGLASQSILLVAREMGLGGCMFRSFSADKLAPVLNKTGYIPVLVIALGEPDECVYVTEATNAEIKYYRDENDNHAVPKLSVDELII